MLILLKNNMQAVVVVEDLVNFDDVRVIQFALYLDLSFFIVRIFHSTFVDSLDDPLTVGTSLKSCLENLPKSSLSDRLHSDKYTLLPKL